MISVSSMVDSKPQWVSRRRRDCSQQCELLCRTGWFFPAFVLVSALFDGADVSAAPRIPRARRRPSAEGRLLQGRSADSGDKCYTCHGPKKQKADLRLDQRHAAFVTAATVSKRSSPATVRKAS